MPGAYPISGPYEALLQAGGGNRTLISGLEGRRSTIELRPRGGPSDDSGGVQGIGARSGAPRTPDRACTAAVRPPQFAPGIMPGNPRRCRGGARASPPERASARVPHGARRGGRRTHRRPPVHAAAASLSSKPGEASEGKDARPPHAVTGNLRSAGRRANVRRCFVQIPAERPAGRRIATCLSRYPGLAWDRVHRRPRAGRAAGAARDRQHARGRDRLRAARAGARGERGRRRRRRRMP